LAKNIKRKNFNISKKRKKKRFSITNLFLPQVLSKCFNHIKVNKRLKKRYFKKNPWIKNRKEFSEYIRKSYKPFRRKKIKYKRKRFNRFFKNFRN